MHKWVGGTLKQATVNRFFCRRGFYRHKYAPTSASTESEVPVDYPICAQSAFNHTYSLLEHILVPFSNTPALCCKTGAQASTRRRTTSHRSRPRTRAYRSNAPHTAKQPRTAKRPRATPSPSPRAGSLSNSDAWKSLKLRAASLHDYKLPVLGSSWGFP